MYVKHNVGLTETQKNSLKNALNKGEAVSLRVSAEHLRTGNVPLLLTKTQLNQINTALSSGKDITLELSKSQIQAMTKDGGFLPLLLKTILGSGLYLTPKRGGGGLKKKSGKGLLLGQNSPFKGIPILGSIL